MIILDRTGRQIIGGIQAVEPSQIQICQNDSWFLKERTRFLGLWLPLSEHPKHLGNFVDLNKPHIKTFALVSRMFLVST